MEINYDDFKKITIDKTKSYMDSISVEKVYDIFHEVDPKSYPKLR